MLTPTSFFSSILSLLASHQCSPPTELSLIPTEEQLLFTITKISCFLKAETLWSLSDSTNFCSFKELPKEDCIFRPFLSIVKKKEELLKTLSSYYAAVFKLRLRQSIHSDDIQRVRGHKFIPD